MKISYRTSYSFKKPSLVVIDVDHVYFRTNIESFEHTTSSGVSVTCYKCDEAYLTFEEFNEYADFVSRQNALKGVDDSENIASLVSSQSVNEFNQLATMEAAADLYELMSNNEFNQLATMEAIADLYEALSASSTT